MRGWMRLAVAGAAMLLLCSCSEFEPVEPYLRVIIAEPSPWHAELDRQTGNLLFPEVVIEVGNWSLESAYLTSYEIRYFDVETYGAGDLSAGNTFTLEEGDTLWVWTSAYGTPTHYVVTDEPGNNTYPPGPVVRYGGTRAWIPPVDAADYGTGYTKGECSVMAADAVLRGISEFWLVKNRSQEWAPPPYGPSSHDDVGIVAVIKLTGETEGGDDIEIEAHVDVGTYVIIR